MNKIIMTAALFGAILVNAASAEVPSLNGNVGTKFASDYHRRGEVLSAEAIQAQIGFSTQVLGADVFGDFLKNHGTDTGASDTSEVTVGVATSLFDSSFDAYLGVYNTDTDGKESSLEAFVSLQANLPLSPRISVFRDTEDALYTFEGQLSYDVDIDLVGLEIAGILGNTDSSATNDSTYLGAKVTASKTIGENVDIYADVSLSDTDDRDSETLWGVGLSVKF
jgi:hypothetical protein